MMEMETVIMLVGDSARSCAEGIINKLALLVDLERPVDELHCLGDVALGLELHEAPVHEHSLRPL